MNAREPQTGLDAYFAHASREADLRKRDCISVEMLTAFKRAMRLRELRFEDDRRMRHIGETP